MISVPFLGSKYPPVSQASRTVVACVVQPPPGVLEVNPGLAIQGFPAPKNSSGTKSVPLSPSDSVAFNDVDIWGDLMPSTGDAGYLVEVADQLPKYVPRYCGIDYGYQERGVHCHMLDGEIIKGGPVNCCIKLRQNSGPK